MVLIATYSIVVVQDFRRPAPWPPGWKMVSPDDFAQISANSKAFPCSFLGQPWIQYFIYIYILYTYIHTYIHTCRVRSEGRQKACRPTAPKMGPRRSASQRHVSKGAGMPVLFCSKHARLNFDCHKQCKDICTASGSVQDPGHNPRHPQGSKAFVSGNVDSWGAGPFLRLCCYKKSVSIYKQSEKSMKLFGWVKIWKNWKVQNYQRRK